VGDREIQSKRWVTRIAGRGYCQVATGRVDYLPFGRRDSSQSRVDVASRIWQDLVSEHGFSGDYQNPTLFRARRKRGVKRNYHIYNTECVSEKGRHMPKLRLPILFALAMCVIEIMLVWLSHTTLLELLIGMWTPVSPALTIDNGLNAPAVVMASTLEYLWNLCLRLTPSFGQDEMPWHYGFYLVCIFAWWFFLGVCFGHPRSKMRKDQPSVPAWITLLGGFFLLALAFKLGHSTFFNHSLFAVEAINKAFWETWALLAASLGILLFLRGVQSMRKDARHRVDLFQGIIRPSWITVIALSIFMVFCASDLLMFRHMQSERQRNQPKTRLDE
jgi:hypothetical protein